MDQGPDLVVEREPAAVRGRPPPPGWSLSRARPPAPPSSTEAHVERAKAVIVATHSDEAAVLVTLTVAAAHRGQGADHRGCPRGGERSAAQAERRAPGDRVVGHRRPAARHVHHGTADHRRRRGPADARRGHGAGDPLGRRATSWASSPRELDDVVIALVRRGKVVTARRTRQGQAGGRRHDGLRPGRPTGAWGRAVVTADLRERAEEVLRALAGRRRTPARGPVAGDRGAGRRQAPGAGRAAHGLGQVRGVLRRHRPAAGGRAPARR